MTPIYNQYLRLKLDVKYVSEIAFINNNNPIIKCDTFYVEFNSKLNKKPGFFTDNNNYLRNLYLETTKDSILDTDIILLKHSNNMITKVQRAMSYYSYVKIIFDSINPQLNDQIMIFKFGKKISDKISEYLQSEKQFNNTFKLIIENKYGYSFYDNSYFTLNDFTITDLNLDIESEIFFKQINVKQIEREEKLKKLTSEIDLKNERYQEYLKLKEEFEK